MCEVHEYEAMMGLSFDEACAYLDTHGISYEADAPIDATHLTPKARKRVLDHIKSKDNKLVIDAIVIRPTLEQHIKQNANRTGRAFVPVDAIVKQYNSYIKPTCEEGFNHIW